MFRSLNSRGLSGTCKRSGGGRNWRHRWAGFGLELDLDYTWIWIGAGFGLDLDLDRDRDRDLDLELDLDWNIIWFRIWIGFKFRIWVELDLYLIWICAWSLLWAGPGFGFGSEFELNLTSNLTSMCLLLVLLVLLYYNSSDKGNLTTGEQIPGFQHRCLYTSVGRLRLKIMLSFVLQAFLPGFNLNYILRFSQEVDCRARLFQSFGRIVAAGGSDKDLRYWDHIAWILPTRVISGSGYDKAWRYWDNCLNSPNTGSGHRAGEFYSFCGFKNHFTDVPKCTKWQSI